MFKIQITVRKITVENLKIYSGCRGSKFKNFVPGENIINSEKYNSGVITHRKIKVIAYKCLIVIKE